MPLSRSSGHFRDRFDDVQTAAYLNPRLTTVRQPLRRMGEAAAVSLLERISNRKFDLKTSWWSRN